VVIQITILPFIAGSAPENYGRPLDAPVQKPVCGGPTWAVSELGRRAKYYRLTPAGRRQLAVEADGWERMVAAIGRVMKLA
jgi:hypothetical protein